MNINNFYKESIGLEDIEYLILGILKNKLDWKYNNLEIVIEETNKALSEIKKVVNNIVTLKYQQQELLINISTYIEKLTNDEKIQKINFDNLKYFKTQIKKLKGYRRKVDFLKKFLEMENRMKYDRITFLEKISDDFANLKIEYNKKDQVRSSKWNSIIDLPFSDINLEWHWFHEDNTNIALERIQIMIDKTIQRQIESWYQYETINLLFLGNIINRNLILEQDFQESLINYNLTFEFSIFIVKTILLLRQFFPKVNWIFTIDKNNFRPKELIKEHFRNYNINFDRVIPHLLNSFLKKNKELTNVNVLWNSEDHYYAALIYKNWTSCISFGDIKIWNNSNKINFNSFEKKFLKSLDWKEEIKRISRFYIGWENLYIYNDFYRKIRQIPSLGKLTSSHNKLLFFTLNKNWEEIEKIWVDVLEEEPKITLHNINYKNDIQYYDYIKNTNLTNKKDKQNIILKL